jgi:hypothetical protein
MQTKTRQNTKSKRYRSLGFTFDAFIVNLPSLPIFDSRYYIFLTNTYLSGSRPHN